MLDLERIYDVYLDKLQEKREEDNKEYKEWFGGSSAGSCYKKQWYKISGAEPTPFDTRTKRLLRLGTIVHKDILEEAIDYWKEEYREIDPDQYTIYTEWEVKIPEFKVIGHLDNCLVEKHEDGTYYITIADLKTLAAYSWTKKFGREAKKKGTESITLHGILLMKKTVITLSKAIHTHLNEEVAKPGRMKSVTPFLAMLENDVASFISLNLGLYNSSISALDLSGN